MSDDLSELPVELLHMILNHLTMTDILTSLCFVNKHFYTICLTYPSFHFDFSLSAKKKEQFDLVCARLPNISSQIRSLIFFNQCDPVMDFKVARFFSKLDTTNGTLSKLHSITLHPINFETWRLINDRLTLLPSLLSLSINSINLNDVLDISIVSKLLNDLLCNSATLKRLAVEIFSLHNRTFIVDLRPTAMKSLIEHLTLHGFQVELKSLLKITPKLKTLNIQSKAHRFIPAIYLHAPHTMRNLTIKVHGITFDEIEYLLHSMTQLTHFTIIADYVGYDMIDGIAWSRLLKTIVIFKFKFVFKESMFKQSPIDLTSFRTSFWLEEKHWYVTYDRCIDTGYSLLYSTPYCDNDYPLYYMQDFIHTVSTAPTTIPLPPTESLMVDCIDSNASEILRQLTHITHWSLDDCGTCLDAKLSYATVKLDLSRVRIFFAHRYETDMLNDVLIRFVRDLPCL
ncbi:unnamed protein product [Rotaria sordida]|uniref:F-box domain-containing protein n=1 Tax=Rotaria sordida TaxID=392033 RepID=A0A819TYJ2_9BILA|nr:unnamed protein product [Rotaria sordida]